MERHQVILVSRATGDIADPQMVAQLEPADHVFHLAARTFVPDSWDDITGFLSANVLGTANVLAYCRRVSAPLTFVSAYVYGRPSQLPIREDTPPRPNNPYALSKFLAEQLCEFSARADGTRVTVVRPFNIYGAEQPARFLIPTILKQVAAGGPIRVMDLAPKRDYLHVDDLVALLARTVDTVESDYRVVNAGSGTSHSVSEIIDLVQQIAGTSYPVVDECRVRPAEIDDVRADITLAGEVFGWEPRISLRDGLHAMFADGRRAT